METVRYTYRLRPGAKAVASLNAEWDRNRALWNECVALDRRLRADREYLSGNDMGVELTRWRAHNPWIREGSQNAQANTTRTWGRASYDASRVKGRGRPKYKGKRIARPSLEYTTNGFRLRDGRLALARSIVLPVVWHRELPSTPSSVRVFRDAVGDWWASFVVKRGPEAFPKVSAGIGVDWGVRAVATTTDHAFDLSHPQHGKTAAGKLAAYQRRMARRAPKRGQKASTGYRNAKADTAKLHRKVARQRQHTARTWARRVVTHHDLIAIEDFKPKFLAKSTMARKAADGAIGRTKAALIEYGTRAGRTVVMVPPAYTTMTCGECGARTKRLPLAERTFRCDCGHVADRDRNAARVILAAAELNGASADGVRHELPPGTRAA